MGLTPGSQAQVTIQHCLTAHVCPTPLGPFLLLLTVSSGDPQKVDCHVPISGTWKQRRLTELLRPRVSRTSELGPSLCSG